MNRPTAPLVLCALMMMAACPGQDPEPKTPGDRPGPADGVEDAGGTETGTPEPAT